MRPLSKRLQVIFDLIEDNAKVADIGTDHAYLPIALSLSGKSENIIACDIKEKPLKKARENINKFGIKNIDTRLGNGLSPINFGEADTVVIAGMGGDVISAILMGCSWAKSHNITFLLQPMTSAEVLREFLINNCFEIISETPLTEEGKIYSVIKVKYSGIKSEYDKGFFYTGKVSPHSPDGKAYIIKQLNRISKVISDLETIPDKKAQTEEYKKIESYIKSILEIC